MANVIYTGKEAQHVCNAILESNEGGPYSAAIEGYEHRSAGYWKEDGKWIAYDNTAEDCWVEEFKTRKEAISYVYDVIL